MMIAIHWRIRTLIEYYLVGALSPGDRSQFELHIAQCSQCREKFEKEKEFHRQISSTKQILDKSWNRTYARLMELPAPAGPIPGLVNPRSKKTWLHWPIQDWQLATMTSKIAAVVILLAIVWFYLTLPRLTPIVFTQRLGDGIWKQSSNQTQWEKVNVNTKFQPGDRIHTDEFEKGIVKLGKIGQVWINSSSELKLMTNSSTALEITQGEVFVALTHYHKAFQVKTPGGLVRVFGTEFLITSDSERKTTISCIQNTVYFENAKGKVIVPSGYQSSVQQNSSPGSPELVDIAKLVYWKDQFDQLSQLPESERKRLHESYVTHADRLFDDAQYQEALNRYWIAAFLEPDDYSPYYGIGRSYSAMGNYGLATVTYLRALERNQNATAVAYQFSQVLMELKQYAASDQILQQLIQKRPNSHTEWVLLGNNYLLQDKIDLANQAYQQALKLGAESCGDCNPQVYGGLAEIARQKDDLKTAQEEIKKAYQNSVLPPIVYLESARVYHDLGNFEQEKIALLNYLKLNPYGGFAQDARTRLNQLRVNNL